MTETKLLGPDPAFGRAFAAARRAPVTFVFLAACLAVFAVAEHHGSTTDVETLVRFGATERRAIWAGEWWRLLTSAFLHVGVLHLVWNLVGMYGWCVPLEALLGSRRFALLYLGGALAASGTSVALQDAVSAGASGAGFAMVAASFVQDRLRLGSWAAFLGDLQTRRRVVHAVVWTVVLGFAGADNFGHAGGFAAGLALGWWLLPRPEGAPPPARWAPIAAAGLVSLAVALALVPRPGLPEKLHEALTTGDHARASLLVEEALRAGELSPQLQYLRTWVQENAGDLEGAARTLEALEREEVTPSQRRAIQLRAKALLARRLHEGAGMPRDPARALKLSAELCAEGEAYACDWVKATSATEPVGVGR